MEKEEKNVFWWIKLQNDFFEKDEVKIIESVPDGARYIVFYIKLLLKSANTDGHLMFRDVIPYTEDMLAAVTKTDPTTVKHAINLFLKLGLMEKIDSGTLHMLELKKMVGAETGFARKKREYREKLKVEDKKKTNERHEKDIVFLENKTTFIEKEDTSKTKKDNVRQEYRDKSIELRQQTKETEKIVADNFFKKWEDFSTEEQTLALAKVGNSATNKIGVALTILRQGEVKKDPLIISKRKSGPIKGLGTKEYEELYGKFQVDPEIKSIKDFMEKHKKRGGL